MSEPSTFWLSAWRRTLLRSRLPDTAEHWLQGLSVIRRFVSTARKPAPLRSASERRNWLPDDDLGESVSHRAGDAASRLGHWVGIGSQSRRQGLVADFPSVINVSFKFCSMTFSRRLRHRQHCFQNITSTDKSSTTLRTGLEKCSRGQKDWLASSFRLTAR